MIESLKKNTDDALACLYVPGRFHFSSLSGLVVSVLYV